VILATITDMIRRSVLVRLLIVGPLVSGLLLDKKICDSSKFVSVLRTMDIF